MSRALCETWDSTVPTRRKDLADPASNIKSRPDPVMLSEAGSSKGRSPAAEASLPPIKVRPSQALVAKRSKLRCAKHWHPTTTRVYNRSLNMHPARIAELLHPFLSPGPCHSEPGQRPGEEPAVLSATQLNNISTYIDIFLHWNSRINLTAIRDPEEIITRHFGESLFAARHLFPKVGHEGKTEKNSSAHSAYSAVKDFPRVADLGSGAGFPGVPIKLWAPNITLTLIESNHKKATFLRELTRALTLTDVNIQNARAETLPPSTFDVVTLRAVERFVQVLPIAATLLAPSGRLALLIASSQLDQARSTLPDLSWDSPIPIPHSKSRILLTGRVP